MALPHLLTSIFICVSFHWQPTKLVYLEEVLASLATYKTYTEVVINTDRATELEEVLGGWEALPSDVQTVQALDDEADTETYKLLWAHRPIMEQAYEKGRFTSYLYIEDDQIISWPAMVSWGWDMQALLPGGWQRGFFRTEVSPDHGQEVLMDVDSQIDLSRHPQIVDLGPNAISGVPSCSAVFNATGNRAAKRWGHHSSHESLAMEPCFHQFYVQMIEPFQGFWIATHDVLGRFMESAWWKKESALVQPIAGISIIGGYPERTTWGIQLFDIPEGFWSALVVPYDPSTLQLEHLAKVRHLRNGYTTQEDGRHILGILETSQVLVQTEHSS